MKTYFITSQFIHMKKIKNSNLLNSLLLQFYSHQTPLFLEKNEKKLLPQFQIIEKKHEFKNIINARIILFVSICTKTIVEVIIIANHDDH